MTVERSTLVSSPGIAVEDGVASLAYARRSILLCKKMDPRVKPGGDSGDKVED